MSDKAGTLWLHAKLAIWPMIIPEQLIMNCRKTPERQAWLDSLPSIVEELTDRWSLLHWSAI